MILLVLLLTVLYVRKTSLGCMYSVLFLCDVVWAGPSLYELCVLSDTSGRRNNLIFLHSLELVILDTISILATLLRMTCDWILIKQVFKIATSLLTYQLKGCDFYLPENSGLGERKKKVGDFMYVCICIWFKYANTHTYSGSILFPKIAFPGLKNRY